MLVAWLFLALLGVTAFFNLAEMALIAVRASSLAVSNDPRAKHALLLKRRPGLFLAAIRAGDLVTDLLTGAFVVTALEAVLRGSLAGVPLPGGVVGVLGSVSAFAAVSFIILIFGDLAPKSVALASPERWALAIAWPLRVFIVVAQPFFVMLEVVNALVLRPLGIRPGHEAAVTQGEIRRTLAEGMTTGALLRTERSMMERVLDLEHRSVRSVMTGRRGVQGVAEDADPAAIRRMANAGKASRLLVLGSGGEPVGVVRRSDLFAALAEGGFDLPALVRPVHYVAESASVLSVLAALKDEDAGIAVVVDEHGAMLGVVTVADVLEAIAGDIPAASPDDVDGACSFETEVDGSYVLPGTQPVDDLIEQLHVSIPPGRSYKTIAGMLTERGRHLPEPGERFAFSGFTVEVLSADRGTVTKVRVRLDPDESKETEE